MRVKLLDIERETVEETYGTCELCMSTGLGTNDTVVFEDTGTGEVFRVDGYFWEWGDKFEICIENAADFAHWINGMDVPDANEYDFAWLQGLVCDYHDDMENA